eukprot:4587967-Pyramimonas_sp.AAC.1
MQVAQRSRCAAGTNAVFTEQPHARPRIRQPRTASSPHRCARTSRTSSGIRPVMCKSPPLSTMLTG